MQFALRALLMVEVVLDEEVVAADLVDDRGASSTVLR